MGWTADLEAGLSEYLNSQGVVDWAPDTVVTQLTRPLVWGPVPDEPDVCVGAIAYNGSDDPVQSDVVQPVQFWIRGDADTAKAIGDDLFDALHGLHDALLGTVHVVDARRRSAIPMGTDSRGLIQLAHNYDLWCTRANQFRPE